MIDQHLKTEMANAPKTKAKAARLNAVLPANRKEADSYAEKFWNAFLFDQTTLVDQVISVKKIGKESDVSYLAWHAVVSYAPTRDARMTIILTTTDDPGVYRMDFVLLGRKKAVIQELREVVSKQVMKLQDKMTVTLSDDELENFKRIGVSMAKTKHLHKEGYRDDTNLVARLLLDKIPMSRLSEKAEQIRNIVKQIGKTVVEFLEERSIGEAIGLYESIRITNWTSYGDDEFTVVRGKSRERWRWTTEDDRAEIVREIEMIPRASQAIKELCKYAKKIGSSDIIGSKQVINIGGFRCPECGTPARSGVKCPNCDTMID